MDTLLYLLKFMKGIALKRWGGGDYYMKLKNPKEHLSSTLIRNTNLCIPEYYKGWKPIVQVDFSVL